MAEARLLDGFCVLYSTMGIGLVPIWVAGTEESKGDNMKVLGVNLATNSRNKVLRDGGACVVIDGQVAIAIAEERVTRIKTDSGFAQSVPYCLDSLDIKLSDLDAVVVSSCLDRDRQDKKLWGLNGIEEDKLHYLPSHHLSHAYSSFMVSPFDEALIIVMDAGGNFLDNDGSSTDEWWKCKREQNSYYIGKGNEITLIGRDFDEPFDVGFGEAYRAFTYYLGWHSYVHSGKTMALSTYGSAERFKDVELYRARGDRFISLMKNDPLNPIKMIQQFAQQIDVDFGEPRHPGELIEDRHRDLAYLIQDRFEQALIEKIISLYKLTGVKNLCLAGGVALNCVANSKILAFTPIERLFVIPAAGDTGQCLGNALYGYYSLLNQQNRTKTRRFSPFLGRTYTDIRRSAHEWLQAHENNWEVIYTDNYIQEVASMLARGYLVGWFCGRSEFGPRSLGARSILADARYLSVKRRLMKEKAREEFMPFAPSILSEYASHYFDSSHESPYMLLTSNIKSYKRHLVPGILHAEMNGRLQTVSCDEQPLFHKILTAYMELTGIPVIINTSFNKCGDPIVESPLDALETFRDMDLDVLVLDGLIIKKRGIDEKALTVLEVEIAERKILMSFPLKQKTYDLRLLTTNQLASSLKKDFSEYRLVPKSNLTLFREYVKLVKDGRKSTSVRYRPQGLHYPADLVLPLLDTGLGGVNDEMPERVGKVEVTQYTVKPFGWLNDDDAQKDGFSQEQDLKAALQRIYGPIRQNEYISIYSLRLVEQDLGPTSLVRFSNSKGVERC